MLVSCDGIVTNPPLVLMQRKLAPSAKQSLVLGPKMSATAVGGVKQNPAPMNKQNPAPMNLPLQLLTPCAWTVHPLEGGLACLPWLLERGGWAQ